MKIDDARERVWAAVRLMDAAKGEMGIGAAEYMGVGEFLRLVETQRLTVEEKETIVDQAILLLDQFYVHLPFKRARYAVDPVQRLRLIRAQIGEHEELAFHKEMLEVFGRLRDAHTFYGLPRPFRGAFAFLPFRMQCCFEDGRRRFVVTNVMEGFEHERFGLGAEITSWNGMAVERAVELEGGSDPVGNAAVRFARGLGRMSARPLGYAAPPEAEWVVLGYRPAGEEEGEELGILLPWYVATHCLAAVERRGAATSVNETMSETLAGRKYLWHRRVLKQEAAVERDLERESRFPAIFEFRHTGSGGVKAEALRDEARPEKRFGYLRIRSYDHGSADEFVAEMARILDLLEVAAPDGLIVDVRSNPGGAIDAAERALGLLVARRVKPASFHLLNTRMTQQIAAFVGRRESSEAMGFEVADWLPWRDDLIASVFSGGTMTAGRPLTQALQLNADPGQRYQGPVVLLTSALSYSAADLFSAGFQDNDAGEVIGVDATTGGGGANRWLHAELMEKLGGVPGVGLKELPGGAQMGLAIRRSTRVGKNAGSVIEDVGVRCDVEYRLTRRDVEEDDPDLMMFACGRLGAQRRYGLRVKSVETRQGALAVELESENVHRLEFWVNGLPQCAYAATDGQPFVVPVNGLKSAAGRLVVTGFELVGGGEGLDAEPAELRMVVSAAVQVGARAAQAGGR